MNRKIEIVDGTLILDNGSSCFKFSLSTEKLLIVEVKEGKKRITYSLDDLGEAAILHYLSNRK